jgi:hypothetical protein
MRRLALALFLVLAACSRTPSSPSSPELLPGPASVAGLWSGAFRLSDCTGDRHCTTYKASGSPFLFTLDVQQTGSHVAGSFWPGVFTVDVTGDMTSDGWVTLSGATPSSPEKGSMRVTAVRVRATAAGGLEGRIAYETTPSLEQSSFMLPSTYGGDIVWITRMPR